MPYPYDDEDFLTPDFNPNLPRRRGILPPPNVPIPTRMPGLPPESPLPELATPTPISRGMGIPGNIPPPAINRQSRYGELQEAKDAYLQKTPGRLKSAGLGALHSFLQGGGLVGAAMGAAGGAIDPRGLREQEFNQKIRPQIYERFGYEDQAAAAQRQAAADELNASLKQAQIGNLNREHQPVAPRPITVAPGASAVDPTTGKPIFTAPAAPRPPVYRDLVDADGQIRTYQINADGTKTPVGGSGAAAINQANIKSREKVASQREAGENSRTAQREAGVNARTQPKPGSKGQAKKEDIEEAFKRVGGRAAGWTMKGMKEHFKRQGWSVPE